MSFTNENEFVGLQQTNDFQSGKSNVDPAFPQPEQSVKLPWSSDPRATWLFFESAIECMLDSGIVVHNRLPQSNAVTDAQGVTLQTDNITYDTLGS